MSKSSVKTVKGIDYITLALLAFAGLGSEGVFAYGLEPLLYGASMSDWTTGENIIHWSLICILWGFVTYGLIRYSKKKYGFDLLKKQNPVKGWQWLLTLLCILLSLYISYSQWDGFKPFIEFQHQGIPKFIFLYLYYIFETLLFTLILIYGQKACELWFKKDNIPYGGIVTGATWGLAHIFTKGNITTGLLVALCGFTYGVVYLLLNRDLKETVPVLFIMFML